MTDTQTDIFQALKASEEAQARVEQNADNEWLQQAHLAVRLIAERMSEFTTDDVWEVLPQTRENRALGPVMKKAASAGLIVATDRVRTGKRVSRHGAPLRVWASKVAQ